MHGAHVWIASSFSPKTVDAQHGFTKWDTNPMSRYDAMADSRSWWSMMSLIDTLSSQAEAGMESEKEDYHDHSGHDEHSHDKMEDSNTMGDANKMEDSSGNGLSVFSTLGMAAFVAAAMW